LCAYGWVAVASAYKQQVSKAADVGVEAGAYTRPIFSST